MSTRRWSVFSSCAALLVAAVFAQPAPARGQTPPAQAEPQTRADEQKQARDEKQKALKPYDPDGLEKALDLVENRVVPVLNRDGLYAKFGGISTGSGFAYGGGYRDRSLIGRRGSADVWAAGSLRKYWALEGRVRYPLVAGDRVEVEGYARKYSYPTEDFFGVGQDSIRANRSVFAISGAFAGARVYANPGSVLSFAAGVEIQDPKVAGTGRTLPAMDGSLPGIDEIFDDTSAPGLASQPNFVRSSLSAEVDYRKPLNARKGGFYRLDFSRYADQANGAFTFTRLDLDVRQYVSFFNERRVLAGRIWMATTDVDPGRRVPFYLMPALGGNETLRGFRARRFYGPHAILIQAEYRFEVWSAFEAALFYDAGKVTDRRADLKLRDLERDYGFGFRFNTDNGVVMRVDAAFGSRDGKHLHVVFGGIF